MKRQLGARPVAAGGVAKKFGAHSWIPRQVLGKEIAIHFVVLIRHFARRIPFLWVFYRLPGAGRGFKRALPTQLRTYCGGV